jgi:hypothetical protein
MITDGLIMYLKTNDTLSSIDIVPVGAVKGVKSPCIVYHIGTAVPLYASRGDTGWQIARFQFDVYSATSYTEARTIATTVRDTLNSLIGGTLADSESTFVYGVFSDPPVDMPYEAKGLQSIEYRVMVQADVHFLDSAYVHSASS